MWAAVLCVVMVPGAVWSRVLAMLKDYQLHAWLNTQATWLHAMMRSPTDRVLASCICQCCMFIACSATSSSVLASSRRCMLRPTTVINEASTASVGRVPTTMGQASVHDLS